MKKVCHLTSAHPVDDIRIYHKECLSLARAGYRVVLVASGAGSSKITGAGAEGIEIIRVVRFHPRLIRMLLAPFFLYLKALGCQAALYHLHDPELIPAGFLLRLTGKKVLYDAHEDTSRQILSKYYLNKPLRRLASRIIRGLENMAARRFTGVVTPTEGVSDGFPPAVHYKITRVSNYPAISEFSGIADNHRSDAICYVGAISQSRGIHPLVESLSHHSASLELAGPFYPSELADQVLLGKHASRIIYHGVVGRPAIHNILGRVAVGVVVLMPGANHQISLPVKMFEYMAAGLPVIASDFPLWREIVEGNRCGFCIEPGNPRLLGETVGYLLKNDGLRREMGENGRQAVQKRYNWAGEKKRLLQLYEKVLR